MAKPEDKTTRDRATGSQGSNIQEQGIRNNSTNPGGTSSSSNGSGSSLRAEGSTNLEGEASLGGEDFKSLLQQIYDQNELYIPSISHSTVKWSDFKKYVHPKQGTTAFEIPRFYTFMPIWEATPYAHYSTLKYESFENMWTSEKMRRPSLSTPEHSNVTLNTRNFMQELRMYGEACTFVACLARIVIQRLRLYNIKNTSDDAYFSYMVASSFGFTGSASDWDAEKAARLTFQTAVKDFMAPFDSYYRLDTALENWFDICSSVIFQDQLAPNGGEDIPFSFITIGYTARFQNGTQFDTASKQVVHTWEEKRVFSGMTAAELMELMRFINSHRNEVWGSINGCLDRLFGYTSLVYPADWAARINQSIIFGYSDEINAMLHNAEMIPNRVFYSTVTADGTGLTESETLGAVADYNPGQYYLANMNEYFNLAPVESWGTDDTTGYNYWAFGRTGALIKALLYPTRWHESGLILFKEGDTNAGEDIGFSSPLGAELPEKWNELVTTMVYRPHVIISNSELTASTNEATVKYIFDNCPLPLMIVGCLWRKDSAGNLGWRYISNGVVPIAEGVFGGYLPTVMCIQWNDNTPLNTYAILDSQNSMDDAHVYMNCQYDHFAYMDVSQTNLAQENSGRSMRALFQLQPNYAFVYQTVKGRNNVKVGINKDVSR